MAAFGAAIAVFGYEATQIETGPLMGDRTARLQQTHPGAFVAAWVRVGEHALAAVSLYGVLEGKLLDKDTYATTSVHRSLPDLTPLLNMRSKMRVVGGDLNVSTQMKSPDREAHRVVFDRVAAFGLGDCTRATANSRAVLPGCICDEGGALRARANTSAQQEPGALAARLPVRVGEADDASARVVPSSRGR